MAQGLLTIKQSTWQGLCRCISIHFREYDAGEWGFFLQWAMPDLCSACAESDIKGPRRIKG
jgi:hypothetical protein